MNILRPLFHAGGIWCTASAFVHLIGAPMGVDGPSMLPTINSGDMVWLSRCFGKPRKGDIFVFSSPTNPARNSIKRVAGIPGDLVRDKRGRRIKLPEHNFWMLSDNQALPTVQDSRAYGMVHQGLLIGRATHLIWPPNRWASLRREEREKEEEEDDSNMRLPKSSPRLPFLAQLHNRWKNSKFYVEITQGTVATVGTLGLVLVAFYFQYIMPKNNSDYYAKQQAEFYKTLPVSRDQIAAASHLPVWRDPFDREPKGSKKGGDSSSS